MNKIKFFQGSYILTVLKIIKKKRTYFDNFRTITETEKPYKRKIKVIKNITFSFSFCWKRLNWKSVRYLITMSLKLVKKVTLLII